jgi:uncharacterized protein
VNSFLEKINQILNSQLFKKYLIKLDELEENRVFCKHGIEHSLDVARIAYIKVLEDKLPYSKEVIYSIGLLHDIGRVSEYTDNIPHHQGSVIIATEILEGTSFSTDEKQIILKAIGEHRKKAEDELSRLIYFSDKLSRGCFVCKSQNECYWPTENKNFNIKY